MPGEGGGAGTTATALEARLARCAELNGRHEWAALGTLAEDTYTAAQAHALTRTAAEAAFHAAVSGRRRGLQEQAAQWYEAAVAAAEAVGWSSAVSAGLDNAGNIYAELGDPDRALECYERAAAVETDPQGQAAIQSNRANLYLELGELRAAAVAMERLVGDLEAAGVTGTQLGVALDNAASVLHTTGEDGRALALYERARGELATAPARDRAVNALQRSAVLVGLGRSAAAREAFLEAVALVEEDVDASLDPDHYAAGLRATLEQPLAGHHPGLVAFADGLRLAPGDPSGAMRCWGAAVQALSVAVPADPRAANGAALWRLRTLANVAALMADHGQVEDALRLCVNVEREASSRGLAVPQLMALGTRASLMQGGADRAEQMGPLAPLLRSARLHRLHEAVVSQLPLSAEQRAGQLLVGNGAEHLQLAKLAAEYSADDVALEQCLRSVAVARAAGAQHLLVNRLAELRLRYSIVGDETGQARTVEEIERLLAGEATPRAQVVGHRALAAHLEGSDPAGRVRRLRSATQAAERARLELPGGRARSAVARHFPFLFRDLARALRAVGDDSSAFEALQGEKGRRLIDVQAQRTGLSDAPATVEELRGLLADLDGATTFVDLAIEPAGITAYVVLPRDVRSVHVPCELERLGRLHQVDVSDRPAVFTERCMTAAALRALAEGVDALVPPGHAVLIAPDDFLGNLPLHVVPVGGRPWCQGRSLSYAASAASLRFASLRTAPVRRALVVGDSAGDLDGAAREVDAVAQMLGTRGHLGAAATFATVRDALTAELDVVHLAVHGRGDVRRGGAASLLLAAEGGGTAWVRFTTLAALPWRADLVVFSGCSTSVVGLVHGHDQAGVALSAAEAGASAVVGSLWPVDDRATERFMRAFYEVLTAPGSAGLVDLREAMAAGQAAVGAIAGGQKRDGRRVKPVDTSPLVVPPDVAATAAWAPFVLLGDPLVAPLG